MTVDNNGYNLPSTFQMVKSINNESPIMLQVHKDEFDRINKKVNANKQLTKPYTDYIQMLYIKYILNKKKIQSNIKVIQPSHIGIRMLQTALT